MSEHDQTHITKRFRQSNAPNGLEVLYKRISGEGLIGEAEFYTIKLGDRSIELDPEQVKDLQRLLARAQMSK